MEKQCVACAGPRSWIVVLDHNNTIPTHVAGGSPLATASEYPSRLRQRQGYITHAYSCTEVQGYMLGMYLIQESAPVFSGVIKHTPLQTELLRYM